MQQQKNVMGQEWRAKTVFLLYGDHRKPPGHVHRFCFAIITQLIE